MAGHGETSSNASTHDYAAHAESYKRFMWWLKFGTGMSALVAAIVVVIIAS